MLFKFADESFIQIVELKFFKEATSAVNDVLLFRYLVDKKIIQYKEPEAEINIQCPCGVVKTYVHCNNGKTDYVRFLSVWAFVVCLGMCFEQDD